MDHNLLVWLHILGLIFLVFGLSTLAVLAFTRTQETKRVRMYGVMAHGLGLLIIFVTGLQMASNLQLFKSHLFIGSKFGIWILLGGLIVLFRKKPQAAGALILIGFILAASASYIGIFKL